MTQLLQRKAYHFCPDNESFDSSLPRPAMHTNGNFDVDMSRTAAFQALRLSSCAAVLQAYRERTQLVLRIMWMRNGTPALAGRILRYLDLTRDGAAQAIWRKARWRRVAHTPRAYT